MKNRNSKIDEYLEGQSPLPPNWKKDLLVPADTMQELNEYEATSIEEAFQKYLLLGASLWKLTDVIYLKQIHHDMFSGVWKWAGEFRTAEQQTNVGVLSGQISVEFKKLCQNVEVWIEQKVYPLDELAVRFHHKLVLIHPFPNGNGRFSRFVANLLMIQMGKKPLPWGGKNLSEKNSARKTYLEAIYKANEGDYKDLVKFATSN